MPNLRSIHAVRAVVLATFFFTLPTSLARAQAPDWEWAIKGTGPWNDYGTSIAVDQSGNVIVGGHFESARFEIGSSVGVARDGIKTMFLAKIGPDGAPRWMLHQRRNNDHGGGGSELESIATLPNGEIAFSGRQGNMGDFTIGTATVIPYIWGSLVGKIGSEGNVRWLRQVVYSSDAPWPSGPVRRTASIVVHTNDGSVVHASSFVDRVTINTTEATSLGRQDVYLAKFSSTGTLLWLRRGGGVGDDVYRLSAAGTNGQTYVLCDLGGSASFGQLGIPSSGPAIVVYDKDGTPIAARSLDFSFAGAIDMRFSPRGTLVFAFANRVTEVHPDTFAVQKSTVINGLTITSMALDAQGNTALSGTFGGQITVGGVQLTSQGGSDIVVVQVGTNGNINWVKSAGFVFEDVPGAIASGPQGELALTGWFNGSTRIGSTFLEGNRFESFFTKLASPIPSGPPVIRSHPASTNTLADQRFTLSVDATGALPLAYQWRFNSVPILDATNRVFSVANALLIHTGPYDVVVTNPLGSVTSTVAQVDVALAPGVVADLFGNRPRLTAITNHLIGNTTSFSAENNEPIHGGAKGRRTAWFRYQSPLTGLVTVNTLGSGFDTVLAVYRGTEISSLEPLGYNDDARPGATHSQLELQVAVGDILEFAVDGYGTGDFGALKIQLFVEPDQPSIQVQPQPASDIAFIGSRVVYSVTAIGPSPVTYQWFQNNQALAGKTQPTLVLDPLKTGDGGSYFVEVITRRGTLRSSSVALEVAVRLTTETSGNGSIRVEPARSYYVPGDAVRVTATPDPLHGFVRWTGSFTSTQQVLDLVLTNNLSLVANFATALISTTSSPEAGGSIIRTPDQPSYPPGTVVTLEAKPAITHGFVRWRGAITSTNNPLTFVATTNASFVADFATFTLTTTAEGGQIKRDPDLSSYPAGSVVRLEAVANPNLGLAGWGGALTGTEYVRTIVIRSNTVVSAKFDRFTLNVVTIGEGVVEVQPATSGYLPGTLVTLQATGKGDYGFDRWTGAMEARTNLITLRMTANLTIAAIFETFSLQILTNGPGSVLVDIIRPTYPSGLVVTLTAAPVPGAVFTGWSGGAAGTQTVVSLPMVQNRIVSASFSKPKLFTPSSAGGRVTRNPEAAEYGLGDVVRLTAVPDRYYAFNQWSDGLTNRVRDIVISASNRYGAAFFLPRPLEQVTIGGRTRSAPTGTPTVLVNGIFATNELVAVDGSATIEIRSTFANPSIVYTLNGSTATPGSTVYSQPFRINKTATLNTLAIGESLSMQAPGIPIIITVNPMYSLNLITRGGGTITKPATNAFKAGATAQFRATPIPLTDWRFMGWMGQVERDSASQSLVMTQDICAEAVFGVPLRTGFLGEGRVEVSPSTDLHPYGSSVRAYAIPAPGHRFSFWRSPVVSSDNPVVITVTSNNMAAVAVFAALEPGQHSLSVVAEGNGYVKVSPDVPYFVSGRKATLTPQPGPGQDFLRWEGDASGTTLPLVVEMNQSRNIRAVFSDRPEIVPIQCQTGVATGFPSLQAIGQIGAVWRLERAFDPAGPWQLRMLLTNSVGATTLAIPDITSSEKAAFYRLTQP